MLLKLFEQFLYGQELDLGDFLCRHFIWSVRLNLVSANHSGSIQIGHRYIVIISKNSFQCVININNLL